MFCTTLGDIDREVAQNFGYDDGYEILNPKKFSQAIRKKLAAQKFSYAECLYSRSRVIIGKLPEDFILNRIDDNTYSLLVNESKYFLKQKYFKYQQEFRFIWKMSSQVSSPLIINCPEAVKYCRRL